MIDTHCHVHDRAFDDDRDAVIARARAAGVRAMLTIGEDIPDSHRAIEAANRYGLSAAAGIHPHQAINAPASIADELTPLLQDDTVVAIGEIGLDYYYDNSPRDVQIEVMRAQLRVARECARPVVFHQRDAFEDFTRVLRELWTPGMRGVVHCFTGTPQEARAFVDDFGLFLGIGGVVTFPKAEGLREAVRAAGAGAIVLETDSPYLAPVPKRGKRNEPAFVTHTAEYLTGVLGLTIDDLVARTDANAATLFGI